MRKYMKTKCKASKCPEFTCTFSTKHLPHPNAPLSAFCFLWVKKKDKMLFLASPPLICIPTLPRKGGTWLEEMGENAVSGNQGRGEQRPTAAALVWWNCFTHKAGWCQSQACEKPDFYFVLVFVNKYRFCFHHQCMCLKSVKPQIFLYLGVKKNN